MKILKRILLVIWALMMLLIALILLCTWKPELTDKIADFLYPDRNAVYQELETGEGGELTGQSAGKGQNDNGVISKTDNSTGQTNGDTQTAGSTGQTNGDTQAAGSTGQAGSTDQTTAGGGAGKENGADIVLETPSQEYDPPSQSQLEIPDKVAGKGGYREIQENQEQVEEAAADRLSEQLGAGETGDGLTFDPLFYPYYNMLDEKGQRLYRQIYANANAQNASFAPVEAVRADALKNVFEAVYNDHPELFWVETAYSCKCRRNGQCVEITLEFNRTVQDLGRAQSEFFANAQSLLAQAQNAGSAYEKEKLVHDALIEKITYQTNAEMSQSAYSALVNGQTVCAGYARAFQYLMQQLGIPCYYCTGYAGENHAWNIILLEDGYYNVDVTWDDTEGAHYDYFNKTDQDYEGTHIRREMSVYLPACNGQQYRNLEQDSSGQNNLRSMEELEFTEDMVRYTLSDYYADCYNQLVAYGLGEYSFYSVVAGEELMQEMYRAYETDSYRQGYMESAMAAIGAVSCQMRLEMEPLKDGKYLITHSAVLFGNGEG